MRTTASHTLTVSVLMQGVSAELTRTPGSSVSIIEQ
jgi:hypothetical protein